MTKSWKAMRRASLRKYLPTGIKLERSAFHVSAEDINN